MIAKPEILFLAHRIPYPPDKGDKIRSWRLFRYLTERFRVHLACFVDDKRDFAYVEKLEGMAESAAFIPLDPLLARLKSLRALTGNAPLSFHYFHDARMTQAIAAMRQRPLAAEIAFSSSMAPYIAKAYAGRKRLIDFCDADSEKWRQYAKDISGPMGWAYAREGKALARAESEIANWADASFAITPEEAAIFNKRTDTRRRVDWWSNGVDTEYFDPSAEYKNIPDAPDVVFVGAMDYRANIDAVTHFVQCVWPKVRASAPEARFAIIGANPAPEIKAFDGTGGILVTGRVDDVRPWLNRARVCVAPLRVARGIQNKVLEAMAMGKAIVASPQAMAGVQASGEAVSIAAGYDETASEILRLLADPDCRRRMGEAARADALRLYRWEAQLQRFGNALDWLGLYSASSESPASISATN